MHPWSIPDRLHRIAVRSHCLLLFVPMILSPADRGDHWHRFIPWVRVRATWRGTSGRIVGIRLGWHRGVFVRIFLSSSSDISTKQFQSSLCSIGEMTALAPISGTFPHFGQFLSARTKVEFHILGLYVAARWVQPSFGAAVSGLLLNCHVSGLIFPVV